MKMNQNPELPRIGAAVLDVTAFGADRSGEARSDAALAAAIAALGPEGGTVVFPAGVYALGPIEFVSGLELRLEKDAVIRFSRELGDYLPPVLGVYEGIRCYRPSAMLHAQGCHDIAVTGEGLLDGQGDAWWDMVNYHAGSKAMLASAEAGEAPEARVYYSWTDGIRPCFLEFVDCERVLIQGVTFKDSPMWTVHPTWCRQVTVRGIRIDNPMADRFHHSPNTDGVNLDGCDTCLVEDCEIYCGDDCICMKSGKNADGRAAGHVCQNVEVRNCRFLRGIGGITMGSEMSGGIRNLYCHDIWMKDICCAIWSKSTPERGGFIEDLRYENIVIENADVVGFEVTLKYASGELDARNFPAIRNIHAENVLVKDAKRGINIEGIPECRPSDISLRNVTMKAELPIHVANADRITLENVSLEENPDYLYRM